MKRVVVLGLLLVTILVAPTVSLAAEARGIRHWIPCFQCSPDAPNSLHVVRSTSTAAVIVQVNIYDQGGVLQGSYQQVDPAGVFLSRQIFFTTIGALADASVPNGLYAAVLFDTALLTNLYYEQLVVNSGGIGGILTGRGNGYNYFNFGADGAWALTLVPETVGGNSTGLSNFFVCNNPARDMATFLGIPTSLSIGSPPGTARLVLVDGSSNNASFATNNVFARTLTQLNSAGASGGSLRVIPPDNGSFLACVKFVRISVPGLNQSSGGYTY